MVIMGIDAHKRSHTVVAVDEQGRQLALRTVGTTSADHFELVAWAAKQDESECGRWRIVGISLAGWSVICSPPASGSCGCRQS